MNFKLKQLLASLSIVAGCLLHSGCSSATVNLNDYLIVDYSGYNTVGTASFELDMEQLVIDYAEAFADDSGEFTMGNLYMLAQEVNGELSESENLSNGDIITFEWEDINTERLKEQYGINFTFENAEYTVEGLDDAKELNLFEYVTVTYEGIAPYGTVKAIMNADDLPSNCYFTADKSRNLKNGDGITLSVVDYDNLKERYINEGYILSQSEKTYVVEGLTSYALDFASIPADFMDKMLKQADDVIKSSSSGWAKNNSLKSNELIGFYFLTGKDGINVSPYNQLYCVYKMTAEMKGYTLDNQDEVSTGIEEFYTYVRFSDIKILPDGTYSVDMSRAVLCNNICKSSYGYTSYFTWKYYTFYGYNDIDSMFNSCVTQNIGKYDYVSTVK